MKLNGTIKFNGGNPVLLCSNSKCRKIIKYLSHKEIQLINDRGGIVSSYCEKCAKAINNERRDRENTVSES